MTPQQLQIDLRNYDWTKSWCDGATLEQVAEDNGVSRATLKRNIDKFFVKYCNWHARADRRAVKRKGKIVRAPKIDRECAYWAVVYFDMERPYYVGAGII